MSLTIFFLGGKILNSLILAGHVLVLLSTSTLTNQTNGALVCYWYLYHKQNMLSFVRYFLVVKIIAIHQNFDLKIKLCV